MKPDLRIVFQVIFTLLGVLTGASAVTAQPPKAKDGPLGMKFVPLPKGTFHMGGGGGKAGKKTAIKEDFEIAIHEVTQGQWQELMGNNPSYFSRTGGGKAKVKDIKDEELKQFPVESVSWEDAQKFIKKLNEKEAKGGYLYRLPTEAEWEYACRVGATSEEDCPYHFYFVKPTNELSSKQANFYADKGPFLRRTKKVGSYAPNKLSLYDMHGNVWEWCADLYDPKGSDRVRRGGGWGSPGVWCTATYRNRLGPDYVSDITGFRLARAPVR